MLFPENIKIL